MVLPGNAERPHRDLPDAAFPDETGYLPLLYKALTSASDSARS